MLPVKAAAGSHRQAAVPEKRHQLIQLPLRVVRHSKDTSALGEARQQGPRSCRQAELWRSQRVRLSSRLALRTDDTVHDLKESNHWWGRRGDTRRNYRTARTDT